MNQNHAFAYANLALPEDIRQCKELGDFDRALALIHQKLQESLLAEPMRQCLLAQEEIIRRLKSRQMTDCIVVEEKVSKEALKKYGEDTVNAVGATWKQSDVFGYEVNIAKLEQIKAGN